MTLLCEQLGFEVGERDRLVLRNGKRIQFYYPVILVSNPLGIFRVYVIDTLSWIVS